MSNNKLTPVDWLIEQFYNNEGILTTKQLERAKKIETEHIKQIELDAKEIVIIKQCAEESTSAASSYSDGYVQGYNRALELSQWAISNLIPPHTEQG